MALELTHQQETDISLGIYHILFVNEFIDFQINDYVGVLHKLGLLNKKVKMLSNRLSRSRLAYQRQIRSCLLGSNTCSDFMYDCADRFIDTLKPSFQVLYYTTRNLLLRAYPDKDVDWMAHAHIINLLFQYSKINQEIWEKRFKEVAPKLFCTGSMANIDISDWRSKYEMLTNEVIRLKCHIPKKANEEEVIKSFAIFVKRLSDIKVVSDCARKV